MYSKDLRDYLCYEPFNRTQIRKWLFKDILMTNKTQAGVLSVEKLKAFKTTPSGQLEPIEVKQLNMSDKGLKSLMAYALLKTRELHIRLNIWDSVEIDLVEVHANHQLVDVNFIHKGLATHRILGVKMIGNAPISFESVSVHPHK